MFIRRLFAAFELHAVFIAPSLFCKLFVRFNGILICNEVRFEYYKIFLLSTTLREAIILLATSGSLFFLVLSGYLLQQTYGNMQTQFTLNAI